jgi:spore maturation protein CgeB
MSLAITDVLHDRDLAHELVRNGLDAIARRHTCAHRVRELIAILTALKLRRQCERHAPLTIGAAAP